MAKAKSNRQKRRASKAMKVVYAVSGYFALGYLPTVLWGDFRIPMVAAVLATIPFGVKSSSVRRGLLLGLCLGALAGVAMVFGLAEYQMKRGTVVTAEIAAICVASTMVMCGLVGVVFAHLAIKRTQRIEDEWK